MDKFVAKPVTLAALAGAIEHSIETSRAARGHASAEQVGAAGPVEVAAGGQTEPAAAGSAARRRGGAVDRAALDSLREDLGGADSLLRIVRLFLEQLDPQAEQIDREARGGELETLARNAHRTSDTLPARRLHRVVRTLRRRGVPRGSEQLRTGKGGGSGRGDSQSHRRLPHPHNAGTHSHYHELGRFCQPSFRYTAPRRNFMRGRRRALCRQIRGAQLLPPGQCQPGVTLPASSPSAKPAPNQIETTSIIDGIE